MLEFQEFMKLVCPGCGGTYSLEGWENDAAVRQFNAVMSALPHQVQQYAAKYLGLFRVGTRGLSWKRALRILQELKELTSSGTVHWEGGETRPAPADLWAEVMLEMCEKGKREIDSHNYLRKVVWTRAKDLAVRAERSQKTGYRIMESESLPSGQKRNCFTCGHFRPPKGCSEGQEPASGNAMLGCRKAWVEKTRTIGELAGAIAGAIKSEEE